MKPTLSENKDTPSIIAWHEVIRRIDEETLFAKIASLFLGDGNRRMESLYHAIQNNDCEAVRFLAHTLKGCAATLAAHRLTAAAKKLESAAMSNTTDDFAGLCLEFTSHQLLRQRDRQLA